MVNLPPTPNNNIPPRPVVPTGVNRSPLNLGKLGTKASQKAYLSKRKKLPPLTFILKYISIISLVVAFVLYIWLRFDLDPGNTYLGMAGVDENTYQKHFTLKNNNTTLKSEISKISDQINEKKERIEKKNFFEHQKEIKLIQSQQKLQWFDERGKKGQVLFGVFDSFNRMKDFFMASDYSDIEGGSGVVGGRQLLSRNTIEIKNVTIDNNSANFSVESSNLFEKTFFLSSEFVDMMNSFSFFKNGKINNFTRQNLQKQEGMNFTLKLDIQNEEEVDPADERFKEYLKWAREQSRASTTSSTSTRKPTPRPRSRRTN